MDIVYHNQVALLDFKIMRVKITDDSRYDEIMRLVFRRIKLLESDFNGTFSDPCEYPPLIGWRKHRFHVGIDQEPDMRIIFKLMKGTILILAIGFHNYVYKEAERRDQRSFKQL